MKPFTQDILEQASDLITRVSSITAAAKKLGYDESILMKRLIAGYESNKLGRFKKN